MRFNALLVAACLFAVGGVAALRPVRETLGIALDHTWQLALIHAELVLAPMLFLPLFGGRGKALSNFTTAAACWAAGAAVVLLFSFVSLRDVGLETRWLSAAVWLLTGGLISLGARLGRNWVGRARIALLCLFALPPLWHYLALEYSGASASHLKAFSPSWGLATGEVALWPMILLASLVWVAVLALPGREDA